MIATSSADGSSRGRMSPCIGSPSESRLMDLKAAISSPVPGEAGDANSDLWKSEVATLEEEIAQLRSTAAWALPRIKKTHAEADPESPETLAAWPSPQNWPSARSLPFTSNGSQASPQESHRTPPESSRTPAASSRTRTSPQLALKFPSLALPRPASPRTVPQLRFEVSADSSSSSQDSEDRMIMFGDQNTTPRGRSPNVKMTENTEAPAPQASSCSVEHDRCGQALATITPRAGHVSMEEITELVCGMEAMEEALQQAREENAVLRQENATLCEEKSRREDLENSQNKRSYSIKENAVLRQENATLREEKSQRDLQGGSFREEKSQRENLQVEIAALREEKAAREERHMRDVAELEGMLEPVMGENSQLRTALQAAEARLEASNRGLPAAEMDVDRSQGSLEPDMERFSLEPDLDRSCASVFDMEPDIEQSCDIDRVMIQRILAQNDASCKPH